MSLFRELLARRVSGFIALSENQILKLEEHWDILQRWNPKLNLTAITRMEVAVTRHYAESLFLAARLPAGSLRIADIGSGAGFPGVPIAVARPECTVTLVESAQKKATFLREATRGLHNAQVFCARAEKLESDYDWLVSRAVRPRDVLNTASRLGSGAALLVRAKDADLLKGKVLSASTVTALPWDPGSCVLMVHQVSRET
ncbi:MAG: 16S rRNA (guanine(527)-N(7))-methyltransferase RsmG [Bryobacteraceae bacterium]